MSSEEKTSSTKRRLLKKVVNYAADRGMKDDSSSIVSSELFGERSFHFADGMLEKLIRYGVSEEDVEKAQLEEKLNSPDRAGKPKLSFTTLTSNFKVLSGRMSQFFRLQYGLIHIISWKQPAKTITVLILYTWLCMWPHLVIAYPLVFTVFSAFIPGYLHRHPMRTPELIKVKKRGQSLWEFLNESKDESIVSDLFEDFSPEQLEQIDQLEKESLAKNPEQLQNQLITEDELPKQVKKSTIKTQTNLLLNMRDLQNLTSDLIASIENGEKLWYEKAGFKDENLSTLILYVILLAIGVILLFGPYIPWRMIFISLGWVALLVCHPHCKKFLVDLQNKSSTKKSKSAVKKEIEKHERNDIIVDDTPEIRRVEVYELQRQSFLTNEWKFYAFSQTIFDAKDSLRIAGKRPIYVDHLLQITPPADWKFDIGYVNEWKKDLHPEKFLKERLLDSKHLSVEENDGHGWIYDKDVEHEFTYIFRRRRLVRECYRYSRPPLQPETA